jgi:hypothetical protein
MAQRKHGNDGSYFDRSVLPDMRYYLASVVMAEAAR